MEKLRQEKIAVIKWLGIVFAGGSILAILFAPEPVSTIYGLAVGEAIGAFGFFDLSVTLVKATLMPVAKAKRYAGFKYFIRYVITGVAVALAFISPYVGVWGTVIGLLAIKIIIYGRHLFGDKDYYKRILRKEDTSGK